MSQSQAKPLKNHTQAVNKSLNQLKQFTIETEGKKFQTMEAVRAETMEMSSALVQDNHLGKSKSYD